MGHQILDKDDDSEESAWLAEVMQQAKKVREIPRVYYPPTVHDKPVMRADGPVGK